jgi:anti-sigma factor RsiW
MNVTRDVARDLLAVVLAGEASEDSKRLVERYLADDPALAREADALRAGLALPATPAPSPTAEKRTLDATRQLLRQRSSTFAVALLFTVLPLSFAFRGSEVTFLMIRDAPIVGLTWWATATVMWGWHLALRRRLRVSGL